MFCRFVFLLLFFQVSIINSQSYQKKLLIILNCISYVVETKDGHISTGFSIKGNLIITNEHVIEIIRRKHICFWSKLK